jgi:hypothetical protein
MNIIILLAITILSINQAYSRDRFPRKCYNYNFSDYVFEGKVESVSSSKGKDLCEIKLEIINILKSERYELKPVITFSFQSNYCRAVKIKELVGSKISIGLRKKDNGRWEYVDYGEGRKFSLKISKELNACSKNSPRNYTQKNKVKRQNLIAKRLFTIKKEKEVKDINDAYKILIKNNETTWLELFKLSFINQVGP